MKSDLGRTKCQQEPELIQADKIIQNRTHNRFRDLRSKIYEETYARPCMMKQVKSHCVTTIQFVFHGVVSVI